MGKEARTDTIDSLPVQLAIRLVLHSVSYSNPLPDWFDVPEINYSAREVAIRHRIQMYLGKMQPEPPFEISLPRKSGEVKSWSMLSVNDQIVLQACVSSIAESLYEKCIDRKRVYSYRYGSNPAVLALTEDPLSSWRAFQNETLSRCSSGDCVLQIDLEDAFRSIDRTRFVQFLRNLFPGRIEVDLLQTLLDSFATGQPGLPLVNDSVFFLGNAYLSVVDRAVARNSKNFIRFVDDYRIFGKSQAELEGIAKALGPQLGDLGFRINAHKLVLSSGENYLESLSHVRYAEKASDGAGQGDADEAELDPLVYPGSAIAFTSILPPNVMVAQIKATLDRPQENLNEGRGRLLMGSLRRARLDAQVVDAHSDGDNGIAPLHRHFMGQLSRNRQVVERINQRLNEYATRPSEIWRLIWLLYLIQDLDLGLIDHSASSALQNSLAHIRASRSIPEIVRLWAANLRIATRSGRERSRPTPTEIEKLHERGYIESGHLLLGVGAHV